MFKTQLKLKLNKIPCCGSGGAEEDGSEADGEVLAVHLVGGVVEGDLLQMVQQSVQRALLRHLHRAQRADVPQQHVRFALSVEGVFRVGGLLRLVVVGRRAH